MKNRLSIVVVLMACLALGCEKEKVIIQESNTETIKSDHANLIRYISVALDVPVNQIIYIEKENVFLLCGENRLLFKEIKEMYDNANEYKLNYEN